MNPLGHSRPRRVFRARLAHLALAVALAGLGGRLAAYPLLEPDEGRNAEVAREMAASNDYLVPRLDGLPYPDKPVLFFAATAWAMEALGPTVLAARAVPLLFTLATVALVGWWAARRGGPAAGYTAAVATATSPLTLGFARTVIMDSALSFFVVAALLAFYRAIEARASGGARCGSAAVPGPEARATGGASQEANAGWAWSAAGWAALALAVLTKGPIGLALPLLVALPYAAWRRAVRVLIEPVGPLLFLAMVLPWLLVMSRRVPGFWEHALVTETWIRLTTPRLGRTGPIWYFVPILLAGALPWSAVAGAALWRCAFRDRRRSSPAPEGAARGEGYLGFLTGWVLVGLAFFSLSQSKRPQYVLPLVPPIALLVAECWSRADRAAQRDRAQEAAGRQAPARMAERSSGPPLPGVGAGAGALWVSAAVLSTAPVLVPRVLAVSPGIAEAVPAVAWALSALAAVAGGWSWLARRNRELVLFGLGLPVAAIPWVSGRLMQEIGRERSAAQLAQAIAPLLEPRTEVVAVGTFPLSLPFYLRRPVLLVTADAAELTSNYLVRDPQAWRLVPGSPLRTEAWFRDAVLRCEVPRIFVTRATDRALAALLVPRWPLVIRTPKYAAWGPCARSPLALGG